MTNVYDHSGTTITNTITDDGDITIEFAKAGISYLVSVDMLNINFNRKVMQIFAKKSILNNQGTKVADGDSYNVRIGVEKWPFFYGQNIADNLGLAISKHVTNAVIETEFGVGVFLYNREDGTFLG